MTDITRKRGDTRDLKFTFTDTDTGLPLNLTGCTVLLTCDPSKAPVDGTTKLFQLTGVIATPLSGVVVFSPTDTDANHVGKFYFDVQITDVAGKKFTPDEGKYTLTQDITK